MKLLSLFIILNFIFINTYAFENVPSYVKVVQSVNARTDASFADTKFISKEGSLPAGTEGEILDYLPLESGNYGVKMRVTKSDKLSVIGKTYWVYHNIKETKNRRFLNLYEDPLLKLASDFKQQQKKSDCVSCHSFSEAMALRQSKPLLEAKNNIESYLNKPLTIDAIIKSYSTHPKVQSAAECALKSAHTTTQRLCYRYIKNALSCGGLVTKEEKNNWHKDQHRFAASAVTDLEERGFTNLFADSQYKSSFKSIKQVPHGAMLVYRGPKDKRSGKHRYHIEMKVVKNGKTHFVSDYISSNPVTGNIHEKLTHEKDYISKEYELIAVMIKPPEKI